MSNVTTFIPAPAGYVVDFDHPQRRADVATYWCFGVGIVVALLFTAQRLYVKLVIGVSVQLDDWLLAVSWVTGLVSQICVVYGFANGFIGVHAWEISVDQFNRYLLDLWISAPIYIVAGSCTKLALLVFYLRLSSSAWMRWSIFGTIAFITSYSIGIFFSLLFACNPVQKSFDVYITSGSCIRPPTLYIATAVFNIASDIILFFLPIPIVWSLQHMPLKQRLGLLGVFGIGSVTIVTSVLRAVILPTLMQDLDSTWNVADASLLIVIESNLIIICGMLPTLRGFFRHVAPRLIGNSTYRKKSSSRARTTGGSKMPQSPLTIGSLPSKGPQGGHGQFGRGTDGIALETRGGGGGDSEDVLDAYGNATYQGGVATTVEAARTTESSWFDADDRSLDTEHSEQSQAPLVQYSLESVRTAMSVKVPYSERDPTRLV